jgi:cytochrome c-type biogenesis protein CcmH
MTDLASLAFWTAAAALAGGAGLVMLAFAARGAARAAAPDRALALHRRQLQENDDLAVRGLYDGGEREQTRAEAGRRLLRAADTPPAPWNAGSLGSRRAAALTAGASALAAFGLYLLLGAPGYGDQPYARRLAEWRAADPSLLDAPQMAAVLAAVTQERPNDPRAFGFLGRARLAAGDPLGAVQAFEQAVALAPDDPDLRAMLALATAQMGGGGPAAGPDLPDEAAIRGMVAGLAARLEAAPDDPEGWARLVRAYGVLGDAEAQGRALARAQALFRDRPEALAAIEAQAKAAP